MSNQNTPNPVDAFILKDTHTYADEAAFSATETKDGWDIITYLSMPPTLIKAGSSALIEASRRICTKKTAGGHTEPMLDESLMDALTVATNHEQVTTLGVQMHVSKSGGTELRNVFMINLSNTETIYALDEQVSDQASAFKSNIINAYSALSMSQGNPCTQEYTFDEMKKALPIREVILLSVNELIVDWAASRLIPIMYSHNGKTTLDASKCVGENGKLNVKISITSPMHQFSDLYNHFVIYNHIMGANSVSTASIDHEVMGFTEDEMSYEPEAAA